jgi:general secretion pathway protein A
MIHDPKISTLYALKFNPFLSDIPINAIYPSPVSESFVGRCEAHMSEGGFALLSGAPGLGKSITLRLLTHRLSRQRDVMVRTITYPQCRISDFYRELGDAFSVPLSWGNRWGSFKTAREKWQEHIETTNTRPVLIVDESQETLPAVLRELRLLTSKEFDSRSLLFVVLAGDLRLRNVSTTLGQSVSGFSVGGLGTRLSRRLHRELDRYTAHQQSSRQALAWVC